MISVAGVEPQALRQVRFIATLLDSAIKIPFVRKRIGLDPILGLVPGGGDLVAMVLSLYIVWVAYSLGIPQAVLLRMVINIVIDTSLGSIPIAGNVFDVYWKANKRNIKLMEEAYYLLQASGGSRQFR
jgi:hypothetical protein